MSSIYLVFTYNICMTSFILLTLASSMAAASVKWDDIHFGRAIYYLIVVIIFKGNRKNLEHQSWNLTCVFIVQSCDIHAKLWWQCFEKWKFAIRNIFIQFCFVPTAESKVNIISSSMSESIRFSISVNISKDKRLGLRKNWKW